MRFATVRLVTDDLERLVRFYQDVLQTSSEGNDMFRAFRLDGADLGLFRRDAAERVHGGEWTPGANRSAIVEFLVDDVDAEHARLQGIVVDWLHGPKDMPWGNRSMLFRDPDGNAVNFYRPIDR